LIIAGYLGRQVFIPTLGVTAIVVFATMSNWLRWWLDDAVSGQGATAQLVGIIFYYIPLFVQEAVPAGFLIGILITYGRLYSELEMTAMFACGFQYNQLVKVTLIPAFILMTLMWANNIWLSPWAQKKAAEAWAVQKSLTAFDLLTVGRFIKIGKSGQVMYVGDMSADGNEMRDIFMSTESGEVYRAKTGEIRIHPDTGIRYLVLKDGVQQSGQAGERGFTMTRFDEYGVKIAEKQVRPGYKIESVATAQLLESDNLKDKVELQWRLASPLTLIVVVMIAVPLSRINPRQGRFLKLFPALILYSVYSFIQTNWHQEIERGNWPLVAGIWWLQLVTVILAILAVWLPGVWRKARS
jgi:lipopolysaccharide export system permease protein